MTSVEYVAALVHLGLALMAVCVFAFCFWRQYRVDALRERLFEVRGELFDYAASGGVAFDAPAYTHLRTLMNSMIRFAHRFSFSRIVLMLLLGSVRDKTEDPGPLGAWERAVSDLPQTQRLYLRHLHDKMVAALTWHVMSGFPLFPVGLLFFMIKYLAFAKTSRINELRVEVSKSLPGVHELEVQAINAELEEERDLDAVPA